MPQRRIFRLRAFMLLLTVCACRLLASDNLGLEAVTNGDKFEILKQEVTLIPGGGYPYTGLVLRDLSRFYITYTIRNISDTPQQLEMAYHATTHAVKPHAEYLHQPEKLTAVAQNNFTIFSDDQFYPVSKVSETKHDLGTAEVRFYWQLDFKPQQTRKMTLSITVPHLSFVRMSYELNSSTSGWTKKWYQKLTEEFFQLTSYSMSFNDTWRKVSNDISLKYAPGMFEKNLKWRAFLAPYESEQARQNSLKEYPVEVPLHYITAYSQTLKQSQTMGTKRKKALPLTFQPFPEFMTGSAKKKKVMPVFSLFYNFPERFPRKKSEVEKIVQLIEKEARITFTAEDYADLRDIYYEYNGRKTGNKRIESFVKDQNWYGIEKTDKIPEEVFEFFDTKIKPDVF